MLNPHFHAWTHLWGTERSSCIGAGMPEAVWNDIHLLVKKLFQKNALHGPLPWKGWGWREDWTREFFTWQNLCNSCQPAHTRLQEELDKIPLRFSLCFGLGSISKATLWHFYNVRKREARLWLMLSGSVLWGLGSYRDWKLHAAMFKKSEAGLCLMLPRLSYALNGRGGRPSSGPWGAEDEGVTAQNCPPCIFTYTSAVPLHVSSVAHTPASQQLQCQPGALA